MMPVASEESDDLRVNLLTQEIKFAKLLAGNEFDGGIKEKHLDKLSAWLKSRTACTEGILHVFHTFCCMPHILIYIEPNLCL